MAIPAQRDAEQSARRLSAWLAEKVGTTVELGEFTGPGATGYSNETIIVDASYAGRTERLVLRIAPSGYTLFPHSGFDTQLRVMLALGRQTEVPVPRIRWHEPDPDVLGAPFFVMEFVDGLVPSDRPPYRPTDEPTVFCWGDSRLANLMFAPSGERLAALDWEMACLGSRSQDLGWAWFMDRYYSSEMGAERLPGFADRAATIARFETRSGRTVAHLDYYEIFAGFRFSVILGRLAVIFKDWGMIAADSPMAQRNGGVRLTAALVDERDGLSSPSPE